MEAIDFGFSNGTATGINFFLFYILSLFLTQKKPGKSC